jgi:hypothetical protein
MAHHANPAGYRYEDTFVEFTSHNGRRVKYPSKWEKSEERFFRETPFKLGLGQIGFITKASTFRREDCDAVSTSVDDVSLRDSRHDHRRRVRTR